MVYTFSFHKGDNYCFPFFRFCACMDTGLFIFVMLKLSEFLYATLYLQYFNCLITNTCKLIKNLKNGIFMTCIISMTSYMHSHAQVFIVCQVIKRACLYFCSVGRLLYFSLSSLKVKILDNCKTTVCLA